MTQQDLLKEMKERESVSRIRNALPRMVIWMAKEAVMEGVKSFHESEKHFE